MIVQNHLSHSNESCNGHSETEPSHLFASSELRQKFEYERLRAERSKTAFSVISVTLADQRALELNRRVLGRIIGDRIRELDVLVPVTNQGFGIITPYTRSQDANSLVTDLMSLLPASMSQPAIEIFEYQPQSGGEPSNDLSVMNNRRQLDRSNSDTSSIMVQSTPLWKRSMDIVGAIGGLVLLSPLLLLSAILVLLSSKGPVFFAQQRTGRGGKPFWIYKFRSMVVDAEQQRDDLSQLNEQDGPAFKIANDPRVTWVGHWLRSLSIDELPQLWNVLRGQMSFVGPRPLPCHEADQCESWQRSRLAMAPGITCSWQVQDRSTPIPFAEWMRMDIRYIKTVSLKQDLRLLFQTAGFLMLKRNH